MTALLATSKMAIFLSRSQFNNKNWATILELKSKRKRVKKKKILKEINGKGERAKRGKRKKETIER